MGTIITLAVGAFIGWNFPQPSWAKAMQAQVAKWWVSVKSK
jgi:hypothetical protein